MDAQTTTAGDPWGDTYALPDLNPYFATSCDAIYGGNGWGSTPYLGGGYSGQMYSAPNMAVLALPTPGAYVVPASVTLYAGFSTNLTALVDGQAPVTVQWYQEPGVLLQNQTNLTLSLPNLTVGESGSYYVIATNTVTGAYAQSADTVVTINADTSPYLTQDIAPQYPTIVAGSSVTFSALFDGSPTFIYGWQFNGNAVSNTARISGAGANALTITDVQFGDAGSYQVFATNAEGYYFSSVAALTVAPVLGFNGGIGWSSQGNTISWPNTNIVLLTSDFGSESNSTFSSGPLYIGAFKANFTYQVANPVGTLADGATFCIQNDPRGAAALGGGGGSLGVGTPNTITPSAELEFNIYAANGIGGVGISFNTNGAIGPVLATTNETQPLVLTNGDTINTLVTYEDGTLTVTLTDTNVTPNAVFSASTNLNLASVLGTNVAYVGFTAADGAAKATQQISDFTFVSLPQLAAQASGANLVLAWPDGIGGYLLEKSSVLGPSANWTPVAATPTLVNGQNQVTVPVSGATWFYELILTNVPSF